MNEDYISLDQAKLLKEFGFNWKCTHYYLNNSEKLQEYLARDIDVYHNSWDFNYTEYIDDYTMPSGERIVANRFENAYSAPTLSQAQKWLREEKNIIIIIEPMSAKKRFYFNYAIFTFKNKPITLKQSYEPCIKYEQALSAGIDKAIEFLKEENNG